MGESAQFSDNRDDPYYTEKVWFGMQPIDGGLTRDECDTLAEVWKTSPEVAEHLETIGALTDEEIRRAEFIVYLKEIGKLSEFIIGVTMTPLSEVLRKYGDEPDEQPTHTPSYVKAHPERYRFIHGSWWRV